eukprot:COSAG01_NODE_70968_length_257_cov_0.658228_1_plen_54_part_00
MPMVVEADHHLQGEVVSLKLALVLALALALAPALAPAPVEVDRRPRVVPACSS